MANENNLAINMGVQISVRVLKGQLLICRAFHLSRLKRISLLFWKDLRCCALSGDYPGVCMGCEDAMVRELRREREGGSVCLEGQSRFRQ